MRSICKTAFIGMLTAGLTSGFGWTQNTLLVGVDSDQDLSTGCGIQVQDASNPGQTVPGFESLFRINVETGTAMPSVLSLVREDCTGGSFSVASTDPSPGFSFQANAGVSGSDVVDGLLPLALSNPFVRLIFFSRAENGDQDVVNQSLSPDAEEAVLALEGPLQIPTLSEWGILLLAAALAVAAFLLLRRHPAGLAMLVLALCLAAAGTVQAFVDSASKSMFSDPIGDSTGGNPAADIAKAGASASGSGVWVAFDIVDLQNSPPVLNLDADNSGGNSPDFAATFTEGGGSVAITDTDVSISDADGTTISSASVTITNPQDGASEVLAAAACAGLTVTPGLNSLSISGVQPLATYAACLASVSYDNTAGAATLSPARNVVFTVNDGNGGSGSANSTVTLVAPTQGVITIVKDTVPDGGQDFDFTTTGGLSPASFSLDDDGDPTLSNTQSFTVNFGTYTVTETAVAGFDLAISCVDPDGGTTVAGPTATIDLDATETVTCTFTNTQRGTINIVKDTLPDGPQDFGFTTTGGLSPASFSLDDDADGTLSNTQTFSNVVPGSYTVTEAAVAGFDLSIACADPDGGTSTAGATATIDLDAGETVTCTFTNTQQGTINIIKDTVPDGPQDFDFTAAGGLSPASFSLDDDADGTLSNTQTFSNVVPGSYTVTEAAAAGFDLSIACADPDGGTSTAGATATIDLDAGESVTCTFTNTQQGTINIVKDTVPDGPQDFDFTAAGGLSPASFSLDDDADGTLPNTQTFSNVVPGSYTVTEAAAAGFDLSIACLDPDGGTTAAGSTATIDLDAGESVTCTFTNTQQGTINIVKDTVPDDPQDFDFTATGGLSPASFSLDDDADGTLPNTQTFSNVSPGSYTVTETTVAGFELSIACADPDGGTSTAGATATIDLDAGETVTCTFTNTQQGTINIVKDTVPDGPQDFDFTATGGLSPANFSLDDDADGTLPNTQTYSNVSPGSYTVTETAVAGFELSIACADPDGGTSTAGATATIDLDAGETVTCTFTNTQQGTINIVKDTVPDDPQDFDFTATGGLSPANFSLDDDADATLPNTQSFMVAPGTYTVTEAAPPATFFLSDLSCVDPDGGSMTAGATATIDLDAGETVTCTFTNTATAPPSALADPNGGLPANSTPSNDGMPAGTDNAYHTALNTALTVPDGAGDLLDNDSLGTPTATMTSFGPTADPTLFAPGSGTQAMATDQNGSLDVNANGSFTYTPPSATFTGLDSFAYRLTNTAGTSDGTVTVAVGLRPAAMADTLTSGATGNVAMQSDRMSVQLNGMTGQTLIDNDTGDQISLTAIDMTSANLGNVSSLAGNHFRYNPAPGFEGADSFMYTIDNGFMQPSMAAVSLTVSDMIWFIDASAACPCDGRLSNPFDDLAVTANSFDANASDDPGDSLFLDAGSYTGDLTLLDNQRLIGDGSTGTLAGLAGITLAAGSDALPVFGGVNPTITTVNADAITLGSGNTVRGLTIGNTGTGTGIFGNFGTLVVREATINGTGQALDLTNGTLDVIFDSISSTSGTNGIDLDTVSGSFDANGGALSGSTGSAFLVNNSTANIDYDGTITNTAGRSVDVQGSSGTVNFTALIDDDGTGIFLDNNTGGAVTFQGGLDLDTTTNTGFTATGGGTVNVCATSDCAMGSVVMNTIDTTTGTAINISSTTIGANGVTFRSISANGSINGILLSSTGGGSFEVTGDGPSDPANTTRGRTTARAGGGVITLGSGGTINNASGDSVVLSGAANVTLRNLVLSNNGSGSRDGISLSSSSNSLTVDNVRITGFSDNGILGSSVTNFTMQHCEVESNAQSADSVANDEANLKFANLDGTATIQNSLIRDVNQDNIRVSSCEAAACGVSLTLNITNVLVEDTLPGAGGNDGLLVRTFNDGNVDLTVDDSTFRDNRANGIQHNTNDAGSTGSTTVTNSTFFGESIEINVAHQGTGTHSFNISGNTIRQQLGAVPHLGNAINLFLAGLSTSTSTLSGTVNNNQIGIASSADSGSTGGDGINLFASGAGTLTANVTNNTIRSIRNGSGLAAFTSSSTGTLNLTMRTNDITVGTVGGGGFPLAALFLNSGAVAADTATFCADIAGNTAFVGDAGLFAEPVFVQTSGGDGAGADPVLQLVGYGGATNDAAAIRTFLGTTATTVAPPISAFIPSIGANSDIVAGPASCPLP